MDRINHPTAIDIGGGRMGFRSKDTVAGIPGTVVPAGWLNPVQEEIVKVIEACGFDPTAADWTQLAQGLQSGALNWAVATGTANAWLVDLALAITAYKAGRSFRIKPPATNTNTTVNVNIDGVGDRRVKRSDGSDPAIGDLHVDRFLEVFDDGDNLRVLSKLPSDRLAESYLGFHADPASLSIPNNVQTLISSYGTTTNNLPGAALAGGVVTIGTTGTYQVTANMASLLADFSGSNYGAVISVSKVNGSNVPILSIAGVPIEVLGSNIPSTRAGGASGLAKLAAGDRLAVFFSQNRGSAQNVSISLDVEFRGN